MPKKIKKNLKLSLLLMDFAILFIIFVSVFLLFEFVIKKIMINYSIDKFYESMRTSQFDLSNSINYIEEKKELPYKQFVDEIFDYLKLSALKRAKYDGSLFAVILPADEKYLTVGIRMNPSINLDSKYFDYKFFKNRIDSGAKSGNNTFKEYVTFNVKNSSYIGIVQYGEVGIRKGFSRDNDEIVKPIILIADRDDEFFFLINRVRDVFFLLLIIVFGIGAFFKIYNTMMVTREIYLIRDNMTSVINDIKTRGMISSTMKDVITRFIETSNLDESFLGLVTSLQDLGEIISGIADRDLFIATLKKDNSLLNPHDEMMTIMFLDIQGFTSITEKHKDDIITIINGIWTEVENVIAAHKGKINKLIGDAALIIFRDIDKEAKEGTTNSSLNAFYSAIILLERVKKICTKLDIDFNFRVGLDYGKIKYGKTGTENNYELGVIGDTVNTASRLEALSKQYHTNLLVTENVFSRLDLPQNVDHSLGGKLASENEIRIKPLMVDRARPKGKKEAKELFTFLVKSKKGYRFIGSDKYLENDCFKEYNDLLHEFAESIGPWKEYREYLNLNEGQIDEETFKLKETAEKKWSDMARRFSLFYFETGFPPAEHFAKIILKFEEFEEFRKNPEGWFKKETYRVKEPSEDWIELGTIELDK